jgi:hypothetical protein
VQVKGKDSPSSQPESQQSPLSPKPKVKYVRKNKECPEGKEWNKAGTKCIDKCPSDKERNLDTWRCRNKCKDNEERNDKGKCVQVKGKKTKITPVTVIEKDSPSSQPESQQSPLSPKPKVKYVRKNKECPKGKEWNKAGTKCIDKCPSDKERNLDTWRCRNKCKDNEERNDKGKCVQVNGKKTVKSSKLKSELSAEFVEDSGSDSGFPTDAQIVREIRNILPTLENPTPRMVRKALENTFEVDMGESKTKKYINNIIITEYEKWSSVQSIREN